MRYLRKGEGIRCCYYQAAANFPKGRNYCTRLSIFKVKLRRPIRSSNGTVSFQGSGIIAIVNLYYAHSHQRPVAVTRKVPQVISKSSDALPGLSPPPILTFYFCSRRQARPLHNMDEELQGRNDTGNLKREACRGHYGWLAFLRIWRLSVSSKKTLIILCPFAVVDIW